MRGTRNPYEVLGVAEDASLAAIKARYRELARRHHSDATRTAEFARMAEINVAWNGLNSTEARRATDAELHRRRSVPRSGGTTTKGRTAGDRRKPSSGNHGWGEPKTPPRNAGPHQPSDVNNRTQSTHLRSAVFNGVEYFTPRELALALLGNWDQALGQLIQRTDGGNLAQHVTLFLAGHGLNDTRLRDGASPPPTRLANLLVEMYPRLPPLYRGVDIRPTALAARLADASKAQRTVRLIEKPGDGLLAAGILSSWRHLEGMADGPAVDVRLRAARRFLDDQKKALDRIPAVNAHQARIVVYAIAFHPGLEDSYRTHLGKLDTSLARQQTWWSTLVDLEGPFAVALASTCLPFALAEANREETKRSDELLRRRPAKVAGGSDESPATSAARDAERAQQNGCR